MSYFWIEVMQTIQSFLEDLLIVCVILKIAGNLLKRRNE